MTWAWFGHMFTMTHKIKGDQGEGIQQALPVWYQKVIRDNITLAIPPPAERGASENGPRRGTERVVEERGAEI